MAYKVFTNGSVLNASEVNDNLMNQSVIVFSSSTARASAITSPVEGMLTYLEDTNAYQYWNGSAWTALNTQPGAWTSYTPTLTNLTLGNGTMNAAYSKNGSIVDVRITVTFGSTTLLPVSASNVVFSLPFASLSRSTLFYGNFDDVGSGLFASQGLVLGSDLYIYCSNASGTYLKENTISRTIPFSWTTGDLMSLAVSYEASV